MAKTSQVGDMANLIVVKSSETYKTFWRLWSKGIWNPTAPILPLFLHTSRQVLVKMWNSSVTRLKLWVNWLNSMWLEIHRKLVFLRVMLTIDDSWWFNIIEAWQLDPSKTTHVFNCRPPTHQLDLVLCVHLSMGGWKCWGWHGKSHPRPKAVVMRYHFHAFSQVVHQCIWWSYPGVRRILLSMEAWGKIFCRGRITSASRSLLIHEILVAELYS